MSRMPVVYPMAWKARFAWPAWRERTTRADHASGPGWNAPDHTADQADQVTDHADQVAGSRGLVSTVSAGTGIDAAAVAAYRASVQAGSPLSERKLAGMFGRTSRRWARSRMAEAGQSPVPA